ncbi:MAG: hypothetical protein FWD84_03105 [Oscillospiraceae bacterium]|nr:hypothetical protein [Oscillospiraceae bacterium]
MSMKEIIRRMRQSFFIIFTGSILTLYIFQLIPDLVGEDFVGIVKAREITAMLVATVITNALHLLLYSKKEPSRRRVIVSYVVLLFGVLTTISVVMIVMGWAGVFIWFEWMALWGATILIFVVVVLHDLHQGRKLANKIHERLGERYRK